MPWVRKIWKWLKLQKWRLQRQEMFGFVPAVFNLVAI
jgi:hypothetical protein